MARAPFLSLDPNLDLPKAFEQIAAEQAGQTAGVERFRAGQESSIKDIYGKLTGDLQQGAQTVQSIYGNAAANTQAAYDRAGTGAQAAAAQNQTSISEFANRLGMDPRALSEVQGRLAEQAQTFELRNRQSSANRAGTINQLGANMSMVAQLGVQAAQHAEAQGRVDLSRKIGNMLSQIASSAQMARSGFTQVKAQQAARAAAEAQKGILQAAKELAAEQRASAREARADARAAMRASRSGGGSSGPDWMTKFMLQNEENDRRFQRGLEAKGPDRDELSKQYDRQVRDQIGRGNAYEAFTQIINGDMTWNDAQKKYKTPGGKRLNWDLIGRLIDEAP